MITNHMPQRYHRITIGVLYNNQSSQHHDVIIEGISAFAQESDINLFCFDAGVCGRNGQSELEKSLFFNLVNKRTIDGIIILPGALQDEKVRRQHQIYKRFHPLPLVTVGFRIKGVPAVVSNCKKGMQVLLDHIVTVHGLRKIAFLGGPPEHPLAQEQLKDYLAGCQRLGLPVNRRLILEGNYNSDSGRKAVAFLFGGKKPACNVILASNDTMAAGALQELIKRGIRVPKVCAVAGFQDESIAAFAPLPLTTVRIPFRDMGHKAAFIMTQLLAGESCRLTTTVPANLVVRDSCGCLPLPKTLSTLIKKIGLHCVKPMDPLLLKEHASILMRLHPEFKSSDYATLAKSITDVIESLYGLDKKKNAGTRFLVSWNELLHTLISLSYGLESWIETLTTLRIQILGQLEKQPLREKLETLFLQALLFTAEKANGLAVFNNCLFPQQSIVLRGIEEKLVTAFDIDKIKDIITSDFSQLGITSCFFSLWDEKQTPLHNSTLIAAFENFKPLDLKNYSHPFLTNRLLPPGIISSKARTTLFIEALFNKETFTGLLIFEIEKPDLCMHEVLRKSLSGALANSIRMQAERDMKENLQAQLSTQTKDILEISRKLQKEKRAYEKLKDEIEKSDSRYRKWFEDDFTGNFITAANGDIINCNTAFAKIFGFSSIEEALGANFGDFYPNKSALEDFYTLLNVVKQIEYYESEFVRKDGQMVHIIGNIIGTFDDDNNLIEMQGFLFDNTERKHLEDELRHAHKMDAIGRLAGGIAHDFNNILTGIMGYSELLLHKIPKSDPSQKDVEEIKKAAKSAASLTRQLLAFSRKQILKPMLLDLNEVVKNMRDLLTRLIGEHINLITELDDQISPVKADRGQIEQVIMNLVINSRDALIHGGTIVLATRNKTIDSGPNLNGSIDIKPGNYVVLEVSDNGVGMNLETQSHVFEPFFTTKKPGQGVGLGLSTVYGIITQSGGFPEVISEPHRGTTMRIYLPQYTSSSEAKETTIQYQAEVKGNATVLLVEDEDFVRELAEKVLSHEGYHVIAAHNAQEALSLIKKHAITFDLLLTDIVMPGISGIELGQKILAMRPEIKVLYMSGYDDKMLSQQDKFPFHINFIQKPFTPELLLNKVQDVLNR